MATPSPALGSLGWVDLTVDNAEELAQFYSAVAGWRVDGVDMGGYFDFTMLPKESEAPVAGICHARGDNAGLPNCWLIYITVADMEESVERVKALGGRVLKGPSAMGPFGRTCFIRDPSGAACALFQPAVTAKTKAKTRAARAGKKRSAKGSARKSPARGRTAKRRR